MCSCADRFVGRVVGSGSLSAGGGCHRRCSLCPPTETLHQVCHDENYDQVVDDELVMSFVVMRILLLLLMTTTAVTMTMTMAVFVIPM